MFTDFLVSRVNLERCSTTGLLGPKFVEAHRPLFQYPKFSSHACIGGRDASLAVSVPLRPSVDHDFDLDKVARLVAGKTCTPHFAFGSMEVI